MGWFLDNMTNKTPIPPDVQQAYDEYVKRLEEPYDNDWGPETVLAIVVILFAMAFYVAVVLMQGR